MKLCYKALLDVFEEIEEEMCKEGRFYRVYYAKVAV
jgi:(-)-germacrene D synthase